MEGIHVVRDLLAKEDYMTHRLKGYLPGYPDKSTMPQIPTFPLGGPGFQVCLPPFWTGISLFDIHEDHESGSCLFAQRRYLSKEAKEDLRWWTNNLGQWNGQTMSHFPPQCTIETDASTVGWGAFCQGEATGGCWSAEEQRLHINKLELLAVSLALKSFLNREEVKSILIKSDSMTVVAHIDKLGGTLSPWLVALTKQIFTWCIERNTRLTFTAQQLPGKVNTTADYLSRHI